MRLAVVLFVVQVVLAFLAFDLFLRLVAVAGPGLERKARSWSWAFGLIAALFVAIATFVQRSSVGLMLLSVAVDWLPWWLLWRFGMRKQFAFLYAKKPGP